MSMPFDGLRGEGAHVATDSTGLRLRVGRETRGSSDESGVIPTMRLLIVGASVPTLCAVRDHQRIMQEALRSLGSTVETVWWEREGNTGLRASVAGAREWFRRIRSTAHRLTPDEVIWHYTPFTFGHRGLPYLVPFVTRRLARMGYPVVPFLHELLSPWGHRGWKGAVHAATTRMVLPGVLRRAEGIVVTTEQRREWLEHCSWLPRRPTGVVPVFSNIPVVGHDVLERGDDGRAQALGVLGFNSDGLLVDVVTAAVGLLQARGRPVRLILIGSPGEVGPGPDRWRASARRHGAGAPEFTGVLDAERLSSALSELDILVVPDEVGPSSRRSTLAAGLAHGLPIVTFETPTAWPSLVREHAVAVVPAMPPRVADTLDHLLQDSVARSELGRRAAAFYAAELDPLKVAGRLLAFLRQLRAGEARCASSV